jgi:ABC-type transport system involved in cytochrome c biogenesis permease subunit
VLRGPLFGIHVSSLLFAYASFALACVIGITYVLLFKEIKAKHLGFFYARLPSLQVLDRMNQVAIVIGWIFLTVGLIVGVVWAGQARAYAGGDPRVQAMSLQDPKIFGALVCWILYSFELFAARSIGWGGRRTAYLSALGFVIVLLNFVPISYFLTRSHNF